MGGKEQERQACRQGREVPDDSGATSRAVAGETSPLGLTSGQRGSKEPHAPILAMTNGVSRTMTERQWTL